MLEGTIRDHATRARRPFLRFFVCAEDWSHDPLDKPLPDAIANGKEPLLVVGAIAGGEIELCFGGALWCFSFDGGKYDENRGDCCKSVAGAYVFCVRAESVFEIHADASARGSVGPISGGVDRFSLRVAGRSDAGGERSAAFDWTIRAPSYRIERAGGSEYPRVPRDHAA